MLDTHAISFQSILSLDFLSDLLVLIFVFFSLFDQILDLLFGQSAFVVGDGDLLGLGCALVGCMHVHDAVLVDFEGNFDLWDTSGCRGDAVKVELA